MSTLCIRLGPSVYMELSRHGLEPHWMSLRVFEFPSVAPAVLLIRVAGEAVHKQ